RRRIDALDPGVGVRRTDEVDRRLARPADVVGVMTLAGDEALIFLSAHRSADADRAHGSSLRPARWPPVSDGRKRGCRLLPIRPLLRWSGRRAWRGRRRRSP